MNNLLKQITKCILFLLIIGSAGADDLVGFYEIPKQHKFISSSVASQLEGPDKKEWQKLSGMERELNAMVKNLQKRQVKNVLKDPEGKKMLRGFGSVFQMQRDFLAKRKGFEKQAAQIAELQKKLKSLK